jgi:Na+/pantothenate symporter
MTIFLILISLLHFSIGTTFTSIKHTTMSTSISTIYIKIINPPKISNPPILLTLTSHILGIINISRIKKRAISNSKSQSKLLVRSLMISSIIMQIISIHAFLAGIFAIQLYVPSYPSNSEHSEHPPRNCHQSKHIVNPKINKLFLLFVVVIFVPGASGPSGPAAFTHSRMLPIW